MKNEYTLSRARHYERTALAAPMCRPAFHFSPPVGWCNDPNGFSRFAGEYHLFFQYHPYDTTWGLMHWGHTTTTDFLHWSAKPCALAPDTAADARGCFSGGAIEWKGKHLLLYTGVSGVSGAECQQQCLAIGDGIDYVKAVENPVIPAGHQPDGSSTVDFRDPYLFVRDGQLYALIGGRGPNGHGRLLLYRADESGCVWRFVQILAENDGSRGSMWECPSIFTLEDREILLCSPQFMRSTADGRYHGGNGVMALIGRWGGPGTPFRCEEDTPLDYGLDFYAPQIVTAPDGRVILIAWMQNWDHCYPGDDAAWYGQLSLPRELFWQEARLCQRPVAELTAARRKTAEHRAVSLTAEPTFLAGVRGRILDVELDVTPAPDCRRFGVRVACGEEQYAELRFDFSDRLLRLDRRFAGGVRDAAELREVPLCTPLHAGHWRLRMVLDRFSAEFFVEDGAQVLSMTLYVPPLSNDGICFFSTGDCRLNVAAYTLSV